MKLQPDRADTLSVTAHGTGWIAIDGEKFHHSLLISSAGHKIKWPCEEFSQLTTEDFQLILKLPVEIVLLGCGSKQQFPHPSIVEPLITRGIGLECMDTAAACRTFNILAGEKRNVAAVLFVH